MNMQFNGINIREINWIEGRCDVDLARVATRNNCHRAVNRCAMSRAAMDRPTPITAVTRKIITKAPVLLIESQNGPHLSPLISLFLSILSLSLYNPPPFFHVSSATTPALLTSLVFFLSFPGRYACTCDLKHGLSNLFFEFYRICCSSEFFRYIFHYY